MRNELLRPRVIALSLAVLALSAACHKAQVKPRAMETPIPSKTPVASRPSDEAVRTGLPAVAQDGQRLNTGYFDLDSSVMRPDAQTALTANADLLRANSDVAVRIEGHADERGSTQYNVALGQRRAEAAKTYLVSLGIDASRISTLSYGKERPADPGHDETAWAKNRRVEFNVLRGSNRISSSR